MMRQPEMPKLLFRLDRREVLLVVHQFLQLEGYSSAAEALVRDIPDAATDQDRLPERQLERLLQLALCHAHGLTSMALAPAVAKRVQATTSNGEASTSSNTGGALADGRDARLLEASLLRRSWEGTRAFDSIQSALAERDDSVSQGTPGRSTDSEEAARRTPLCDPPPHASPRPAMGAARPPPPPGACAYPGQASAANHSGARPPPPPPRPSSLRSRRKAWTESVTARFLQWYDDPPSEPRLLTSAKDRPETGGTA
mmetsp:Transcript_677/g.2263  ORF Transcript_677/g.2263 Transcript_677/m.2263 type:complete len:256 (-) Transcript_677:266-1033(-)